MTDYKKMESTVRAIRKGLARPDERRKSSTNWDKVGVGFNLDNRFTSFKLDLRLTSWEGYYGNSGCSSFFHVGDEGVFEEAFLAVLNKNFNRLMAETADHIERNAGAAIEAERKELLKRLSELDSANESLADKAVVSDKAVAS